MSKSFQNEVPRSRVNITLDLETGGAKKKLELPLKLLVMGDYSNGQSEGRMAERERVRIDRNNINDVLKDMAPRVSYTVENKLREDGSEIAITAMEFSLLRVFAENRGRTLSRDQLLAKAHDRGWEPFDRSIDLRISRIRRKIEKNPEKPEVICTVHGIGYVFG